MIIRVSLEQALTEIADVAIALLGAETGGGARLEGVVNVLLSERSRPRPDLPCLYVYLDNAANDPTGPALREVWVVPLVVVALVHNEDPELGYQSCMHYAAAARAVLLQGRKLGLAYVNDVVSVSFAPAYQTQIDNRTIYGSAATLGVRFTVFDG